MHHAAISCQFGWSFPNHYFSFLPTATVNDLFNTLWNTSQRIYNGNIPPEYLFPETTDLPDSDTNNNSNAPNSQLDSQLATDLLEDIHPHFYVDGEPPPISPNNLNSETQAAANTIPDQLNPSGITAPNPDQLALWTKRYSSGPTMHLWSSEKCFSHPNAPGAPLNAARPTKHLWHSSFPLPWRPLHPCHNTISTNTFPRQSSWDPLTWSVPTPLNSTNHTAYMITNPTKQ